MMLRNGIANSQRSQDLLRSSAMNELPDLTSLSPREVQRFGLMLRTWEAVSAERELPGVLAALADVLLPVVPFDSIGIIDFGGAPMADDQSGKHKLFALHVVGIAPLEGETAEQMAERLLPCARPLKETRPLAPYPPVPIDDLKLRGAEPFACA